MLGELAGKIEHPDPAGSETWLDFAAQQAPAKIEIPFKLGDWQFARHPLGDAKRHCGQQRVWQQQDLIPQRPDAVGSLGVDARQHAEIGAANEREGDGEVDGDRSGDPTVLPAVQQGRGGETDQGEAEDAIHSRLPRGKLVGQVLQPANLKSWLVTTSNW